MSKTLIVTVGGSFQPVVTAIKKLRPTRVLFVCSQKSRNQVVGEGTPCEVREGCEVRRLPNIVKQAGIEERFDAEKDVLVLEHEDALEDSYDAIADAIRAVQSQDPGGEVLADYTGGTKTMSVALAMAAFDLGVMLYIEAGPRRDIERVHGGEAPILVGTSSLRVARVVNQWVPSQLEKYDYTGAVTQLDGLLRSTQLSPGLQSRIRDLASLCRAFEAWDRLDYEGAMYLLEPHMESDQIRPLGVFLQKLISARRGMDAAADDASFGKSTGYELAEDLVRNAERRAATERYDDAVARLYRAVELTAQVRLRTAFGIDSADVPIERLPAELQPKYEGRRSANGKIQVSLVQAYELLTDLGDEVVADVWREKKERILDALDVRNNSSMAHGLRPIAEEQYQHVYADLVSLMERVIAGATKQDPPIGAPQIPTRLSLSKS
ncbi:MAG: TIGR02710 family CRISPR-associated protein [Fimbriimonadia bacterium]|jgi:CRISPR-associated protein (TIGR02710 family)